MKRKIADIIIKDRIREETGDLTQLKKSMSERGLLNPVIIDSNNELIAGYRRIQAAKLLNWDTIECRIIEISSAAEKLDIEAEENIGRKDFTEHELAKYSSQKEYLTARGIKKIRLVLKRIMTKIHTFIKNIFR